MPTYQPTKRQGLVPRVRARFGISNLDLSFRDSIKGYNLPPDFAEEEAEPDEEMTETSEEPMGWAIAAQLAESMPHLEPKVMVPFQTRLGETPRKVHIQRKRKLYAEQDLNSLLAKEGLDVSAEGANKRAAVLPLDVFDNTDFECRTPEEWVPKNAAAPHARGRVADMSGGSCKWLDCVVLDYDEEKQLYLTEFEGDVLKPPTPVDEDNEDADSRPETPVYVKGQVQRWVPRVHLCFLVEDPFVFARRHADAYSARARAESMMRYNLYIDSMPTDDIPPLPSEQVQRILGLVFNRPAGPTREMDAWIGEASLDFARNMNKVTFDHLLKHGNPGCEAPLMHFTERFPLDQKRPAPEKGTLTLPDGFNFPERYSEFSFHTIHARPEVISAMQKIRGECNRLRAMSLFHTTIAKTARLDEFEQMQSAAADTTIAFIHDNWFTNIKAIIRAAFKDCGKGWYSMTETNWETYRFGKLYKFMNVNKFMIEDTVRYLVEESLARYVSFMESCCSIAVTVESPNSVTADRVVKVPLLTLEMQVVNDVVGFVQAPELFKSKTLLAFDSALQRLQKLANIEPYIMERLPWPVLPFYCTVSPQEPGVVALRARLDSMLAAAIAPLKEYAATYAKYDALLALDVEAYVAALDAKGEELTLAEMKSQINALMAELEVIERSVPQSITVGGVVVNTSKVYEYLVGKKARQIKLLKDLLNKIPKRLMAVVNAKYADLEKAIKAKPTSIEDIDDLRKMIEGLPNKCLEFIDEVNATKPWYEALHSYWVDLSNDDFEVKSQGEGWVHRIMKTSERVLEHLQLDQKRFMDEMMEEQAAFEANVNELDNIVSDYHNNTSMGRLDGLVIEVAQLDARIKKANQDVGIFNTRESLFGRPVTDYSRVGKIAEIFEPYVWFWLTAGSWGTNFNNWMKGPWKELHGDVVEKEVNTMYKTMIKASKAFNNRGLVKLVENCEDIRREIDDFKKYVPLVQALRNPGMRDRHWKNLTAELGMVVNPDLDVSFTLEKAGSMGLLGHVELLQKVSDVASKEFSIEQALDKMMREWEHAEMSVLPYRETGTYIMRVDEALSQQLDDHIVMTQSMLFSPYKKPFEDRIVKWEQQLSLVSEILDEWVHVQRSWMYLEPIFSSGDIMQQLPTEGKKFNQVDKMWRKYLDSARKTPNLLKICAGQAMLAAFVEANHALEMVQKGLSDYLETKRLAFARFFFLSNDELLQILSQSKNVLAVQPYLRKCFEAIESLDFADNLEISAMNSQEREKVAFDKTMFPKGNVENWLNEVEVRMRESLRLHTSDSLAAYANEKRTEWVKNWPAMVVLAVTQIYWSNECEEAITAGEVPKYLEKCTSDLLDLTDLVRGHLSKQDRLTLGALITLDVHARDVVQELVDAKISSVTDFEWVSRLRYYWRGDEGVWVDMVQASIKYGYEYLGNTPRLVITPLTDRCYMTLMSAMHINLGGAPAGPAGTGKTETTKDLAKALAKQCVVFNCSDGLDYLSMSKFFKGLSSSGSWACFDEFNRIDLEVLSVVAQQILTIQLAIMAKVKTFVFEDTELVLNPECNVYITMNPGYAGRSELPDNLKALFRPCAMMVPDYALIGEISLYSYGYRNAKPLARKMVATFKLCSEQLSSQDHYDYGMRAVKSVITAAGNLKRDFPDEDEEVLLLRGLRDVNVPKFLAHDLPLFNGIIADLFPGVQPPAVDYDDMYNALAHSCAEQGIQNTETFVFKIIQLYETTLVRHGLMLVGPTMAGKTCCYRTLQRAMTRLAVAGNPKYERVRVVALNPKSITMGQLYGEFDEDTHEWTDGVLACYMRECSEDTKPDKKWMMFDGPVDAIWIENMNTVLDDNKKLCLVSGEIIQLSQQMTMMFEVEDLAVASPATVSRCGMVYMEPGSLGMAPLLSSWTQRLPPGVAEHADKLVAIFDAVVPAAIRFVKRNVKETVVTVNHNLVMSCFNVMDALLLRYKRGEGQPALTKDEKAAITQMLPSLFLFAIVWSVGASCDKAGRKQFDAFLREHVLASDLEWFQRGEAPAPAEDAPEGTELLGAYPAAMFPETGTVYDWCYDQERRSWIKWMDTIGEFKCDPDQPFSSIIVPTSDTVRYTYLIDNLLSCGKHVLCVGETGTGKTLNVMNKLMNGMPPEFIPVFMTFSARTSANMTQDIIDSKMDKRRKGVFGPPSGKKYVIFVDDLNMPQREKYFAQPPIEILRQWFDHEGWYERKPPCAFRTIIDTQFVGSMGPPGGGRNPVTNRMLRHFNVISFAEMSDESIERIFSTILGAYFRKSFNEGIQAVAAPVVKATVEMYNNLRAELLPTPSKSHYTFNLRDLSKVVQGVMRADPRNTAVPTQVLSLWLHECSRVFEDRLINDEDHAWFRAQQDTLLSSFFQTTYNEVVPYERLIYGDYLVPGADPRIYSQITDLQRLVKLVEEYLEDFNSLSNKPMKLVMFLDAIEHVSRICRVIRLPLGNALLLGVGGSGRQSLTRLAAFMEEFEVFQIEIAKGYGHKDWRDNLKTLLKGVGIEGKNTVFLFTDTQIVQEAFLEDINNILNSGEVPNLMANEDIEEIGAAMRPLLAASGQAPTKMAQMALFINRVRSFLHIVLCFSPVGDAFRQRLRMFPSLVNCCTIDWFREWPMEALKSVARSVFADVELDTPEQPDLTSGVIDCCVYIHQSVEHKSKKFYDELRRYNYVTPTSYLELLSTMNKLLGEKRLEIVESKRRLVVGLDKLMSTAEQVAVMQKELTDLQPVLEKTAVEVEEMMVSIAKDKEIAAETKTQVEQQEKDANVQAAEAKAIADDAQRDLDEALPALEEATQSLKSLSKGDIVEVKSMGNPPAGVKLVMEATCIMFEEKPKMKEDPNNLGKKIPDYWEPAKQKLLVDPGKFMDMLMTYDKDNIPEHVIRKIEPYIGMDTFTPSAISKVSKACTSICLWVRAMYKYHTVALGVAPKRAALKMAQDKLANTMAQLAAAQATLKAVQDKIAALEAQFAEATAKKQALANQVAECEVKLNRADKLIGGLGGERVRWQATVEQLDIDLKNVVGDVVVASGAIAYCGPFTPVYRAALYSEWSDKLNAMNVPHTHGTSLTKTLQDPVKVRAWTIAGLPTDNVSVENGIIVSKARRWPLMIDPQGQANKWIKNMEREGGMDVIKLSDKDFLRTLENGVRFGRAVILENIGETLDAALEPLLLKQTFKQGGNEVMKIGDNVIPYHPDFRFYITTKLRNPHYAPEVSVKVSLLNFFVTSEGLEEQLLGTVVTQERPDLANLKNQLVIQNAEAKKELKDIEDKILFMLSNSKGNILDDEELINTLSMSKATSNEIAAKVAEAEETEKEIDATRELYRPVAIRASLLFFCISDLALVDPMYQYSLSWFVNLFVRAIDEAAKADDIEKRGHNLNDYFTYSLYVNVCRSLFETHKLMFSFLLTIKIMQNKGIIDGHEWRFLLAGATSTHMTKHNPAPEWLTDKSWIEVLNMSMLPHFEGFDDHMIANIAHYRAMFDSNDTQEMALAEPWNEKLNSFQKLLFLRCLRPDKVILGTQAFVAEQLGTRFIEPPPFELDKCFKEASPSTPLIFVLSAGADPMADLLKLAEEMKFTKKFEKVSLGQGQGPKAEKLLQEGMESGLWVCLQNCHLAVSWMPTLERIVENIDPDRMHKDFRLWLTSMPSPDFPVSILQNGVKMTLEPPKGLKSNLVRQYNRFTDQYLAASTKPNEWRRLLFGMCLFHAVIQDRRKFGPLGWNIRYDFTDGDLTVSLQQMQEYLDKYETVPYRVLRFLFTEINYGGRVTDDKDRRLINNLVHTFCGPDLVEADYRYSPSGTYVSPACETQKEFLEHIRAYPIVPKPEIFGLHENADITCDQNETYGMFATVLSLQPRVASGAGESQEAVIGRKCEEILSQLPPQYDVEAVSTAYPTTYTESMNTVLTQECIRYNTLLEVMKKSLAETIKALKGLVVMSPDLEAVAFSLYDNQVPEMWAGKAYPSLKPLSSWVVDLLDRCQFIQGWIESGVPSVYWISGFFFPQAFLTGTLQNFARKYQYPIDTVSFSFKVEDALEVASTTSGPDDGCYIRGLYMEGARWDSEVHQMGESRPKELFTEFPIIWLKPEQFRKKPEAGIYDCPVYKTLTRAGTLSTTGHSTNFVMMIECATDKEQSHWINRGVALFTGLSF